MGDSSGMQIVAIAPSSPSMSRADTVELTDALRGVFDHEKEVDLRVGYDDQCRAYVRHDATPARER